MEHAAAVSCVGPFAGISPLHATYFLRRQKVGKKLSPAKPPLRGHLRAMPLACGMAFVRRRTAPRCCARSCLTASKPGAAPNSLRYAPFKQRGAKSDFDASCARAPGSCASRRFLRGGPEQPNSQAPNPSVGRIRYAPFSTAEERKVLRPRAQHASSTDSAQLFDRSVAERVLRGASRLEYRREPRSEAQGRCGRGELFAYFLAAQKTEGFGEGKVGRPPGRNPGTALANNPHSRRRAD